MYKKPRCSPGTFPTLFKKTRLSHCNSSNPTSIHRFAMRFSICTAVTLGLIGTAWASPVKRETSVDLAGASADIKRETSVDLAGVSADIKRETSVDLAGVSADIKRSNVDATALVDTVTNLLDKLGLTEV